MTRTLKLFLKINQFLICQKLAMGISGTQFRFRKALGAREALFPLNILIQRCFHVNKDVYRCLIDYNKVFDKVRHEQLTEVLQRKHLNYNDLRIMLNLHYNQKVRICIGKQSSEQIKMKR